MPDLGKAFFKGEKELSLKDMSQLEASNNSDGINAALVKFGWTENLLGGGIVIELSPDNLHVAKANFFLRGPLAEERLVVQASKCWARAEECIILSITFPAADKFSFSAGGVFSDFLDSDNFPHEFHSVDEDGNRTEVEEQDWVEAGVSPFCLRIVAYPTKASKPRNGLSIKVNVLLFPKAHNELDHLCDATQSPSWPGIRLLEAECQIFPTTANGTWGCPMFPIIVPGAPLAEVKNVPSSQELRHAISCTMRHAARPEAHVKAATLYTHWERIIRDPTSLVSRPPEYTWPKSSRAEPAPGKYLFYSTLLSPFFLGNATREPHAAGGVSMSVPLTPARSRRGLSSNVATRSR
jgi:hypothetical protein